MSQLTLFQRRVPAHESLPLGRRVTSILLLKITHVGGLDYTRRLTGPDHIRNRNNEEFGLAQT